MSDKRIPIRVPEVRIEQKIVDEDGRPTLDFWRAFEGLKTRLGGAEDLPFQLGVLSESATAGLQAVEERIEALEARATDGEQTGAENDLRAELEALRAGLDASQADIQAALEEVTARTARAFEDVEERELTRPIGLEAVGGDDVISGFALLETGSGSPTPTKTRFYVDTDTGTQWYDNGTTVRRTNSQVLTGAATEDTYTATVPTVVAKVHFPSVSLSDEVLFLILETAYTDSSAAATDAAVTAQWSLYAFVDASNTVAAGDNALTAGTARAQIWAGASGGLTFQLSGSDVLEDANDLQSARADSSTRAEYYFGTNASTFDGENVTIALCLDIISAPTGSDGVNLDTGTTFTARLSS